MMVLDIDTRADVPWDPSYFSNVGRIIEIAQNAGGPNFAYGWNVDRYNGHETEVPKHPLELVTCAMIQSRTEQDERRNMRKIHSQDLRNVEDISDVTARIHALLSLIDNSAPDNFLLPKEQHAKLRELLPFSSPDGSFSLARTMRDYVYERNDNKPNSSFQRVAEQVKGFERDDNLPTDQIGWSIHDLVRTPLAIALPKLDCSSDLKMFAPKDRPELLQYVLQNQIRFVVTHVLEEIYA